MGPDSAIGWFAILANMQMGGFYWIVWRIGGQKSHPDLHRVR